ncbi:MAG: class I SAM-dependent methyltransferase [Sulfolobales archaeon]
MLGRRLSSKISRILYLLPWHLISDEHRYASKILSNCDLVVDVGCGGAGLFKVLKGSGFSGEYICVELYIPPRDPEFHTVNADASNPPLRDRCYSCCAFIDSLFYIGSPVEVLKKWVRICESILIIDLDPRYPHIWITDKFEGIGRRTLSKLIDEIIDSGLSVKILKRGTWYAIKIS